MITLYILGAVMWVYCGYMHYGYILGYDQRYYSLISTDAQYRRTVKFALFSSLFGPFALIALYMTVGAPGLAKHGRAYGRLSLDERMQWLADKHGPRCVEYYLDKGGDAALD